MWQFILHQIGSSFFKCWFQSSKEWLEQFTAFFKPLYRVCQFPLAKAVCLCISFLSASVTNHHRLASLNNRNLFPHSSKARSLKSTCWQVLLFSVNFEWSMDLLPVSLHIFFPLYMSLCTHSLLFKEMSQVI